MCDVSCDICKYGYLHNYVPNHYYCQKKQFFNDREPRYNCDVGEIDAWSYERKYGKPYNELNKIGTTSLKQFKNKIIEELNENAELVSDENGVQFLAIQKDKAIEIVKKGWGE